MSAIRSGVWLDEQRFPEPAWAVPGVLPEGCCVLTGHPKIGKSFLVLGIALAVARGGEVLGVGVDERPVLYLALEDTDRRIQARARRLIDGEPLPESFYYITRENQAVAWEEATQWLAFRKELKPLVIIDTLEKIRPKRGANAYQDDYAAGASLQTLAAPGGAVIAVHHNRKNDSSDDFIDDVSGTLGLTGAMDTIINLKRKRGTNEGTLSITGRDVDEMIYRLRFADSGKWEPEGTDLAQAAQKVDERRLGERMQHVLRAVEEWKGTITAKEVAVVCAIPEDTARKYLSRLHSQGRIQRVASGKYAAVPVSEVSQESDANDEGELGGEAA